MLSTDEVRIRMKLGLSANGESASPDKDAIVIVPNPFDRDPNQIGRTSIDLRLGRWFTLLQQTKTNIIDFSESREERAFSSREGRTSYVPLGKKFVLHPNRFVLACTFEWLTLPDDIAAYISGKSALGRMGLIIETAAGIHPGFSGTITLELFNCGEVPLGIYPGMRVCQLFFHEVTGAPIKKPTSFGGRRRPAFGSYGPDRIMQEMLRENGSEKLF